MSENENSLIRSPESNRFNINSVDKSIDSLNNANNLNDTKEEDINKTNNDKPVYDRNALKKSPKLVTKESRTSNKDKANNSFQDPNYTLETNQDSSYHKQKYIIDYNSKNISFNKGNETLDQQESFHFSHFKDSESDTKQSFKDTDKDTVIFKDVSMSEGLESHQ